MKIININSKKIAVQLNTKILGDLIEIENVVEKVGQYGNITKYRLATENDKSVIYLDLQKDYRKFAELSANPSMSPSGVVNEHLTKEKEIVEADPTTKTTAEDGSSIVQVKKPRTNEEIWMKTEDLTPAQI
jgi:hypothetical protein